jgi:hypothetical protein
VRYAVTHFSYLLKWMRSAGTNLRPTRVVLLSSHIESALLGLLAGVSSSSVLTGALAAGLLRHYRTRYCEVVVGSGRWFEETSQKGAVLLRLKQSLCCTLSSYLRSANSPPV